MADFAQVAEKFVEYYYNVFDTDRSKLNELYREHSMLTFESTQSLGAHAITEKLTSLPFVKVKHATSTKDAQPTTDDGILVMVTGQLVVDEEQRPMNYTQTFHLQAVKDGDSIVGYYVLNDIFKLIYA